MGGPAPLSNHDLLAYFHVNSLPRWQWSSIADYVFRIDDIWLSIQQKAADEEKRRSKESKTTGKPA